MWKNKSLELKQWQCNNKKERLPLNVLSAFDFRINKIGNHILIRFGSEEMSDKTIKSNRK